MNAFQVMSTAPERTYYQRPGSHQFHLEDFEVLVMILSALEWRRHNGTIKLYTDTIGAEHLEQLGLPFIWDAGIDTDTLEDCTIKASFNVFWAYARTVALEAERAPCVLLDTDLIIWRNISPLVRAPFMALHSESFAAAWVYPPKDRLHTPPGYVWDRWNWDVTPVNAALMYFGRDDLRTYCAQEGVKYLHNNLLEHDERSAAHAVFVEQRLYPMCASRLGLQTEFFLFDHVGKYLANGNVNDTFTHLWTYKQRLMNDAQERERICVRMTRRILQDFPALSDKLAMIPSTERYLHESSADDSIATPDSAV